jgi:hypothetical protein
MDHGLEGGNYFYLGFLYEYQVAVMICTVSVGFTEIHWVRPDRAGMAF